MPTISLRTSVVFAVACALLPAQVKPQAPGGTSNAAADEVAKKTPPPPTIGVVDLSKAYDNYPKARDERDRFNKMQDQVADKLKELSTRIDETRARQKVLAEGTPQRRQVDMELELGLRQRQMLAEMYNDELRLEKMRIDLAIYEDLEIAIAQVAKDRGVQIVLRLHNQPELSAKIDPNHPDVVQARLSAFQQREVWYAADEYDLTPALIRRLQVPIERAAPAGSAPPVPPGSTPGGDAGKDAAAKSPAAAPGRGGE